MNASSVTSSRAQVHVHAPEDATLAPSVPATKAEAPIPSPSASPADAFALDAGQTTLASPTGAQDIVAAAQLNAGLAPSDIAMKTADQFANSALAGLIGAGIGQEKCDAFAQAFARGVPDALAGAQTPSELRKALVTLRNTASATTLAPDDLARLKDHLEHVRAEPNLNDRDHAGSVASAAAMLAGLREAAERADKEMETYHPTDHGSVSGDPDKP